MRAGRPDRTGRHDPRGAAPADGPRQHLPARQGRRRPRQLLPPRQPHRPARAGPALAGRQGRRTARPVPHRAPHRRHLGDPRTRRRRADRRHRGRHPDPPGRPHRRPHHGRRPARRPRRPHRRPDRHRPGHPRPPTRRWSRASAAPTTRSSATTSRPPCSTSPGPRTPPSSSSAPAAAAGSRSCSRPASGSPPPPGPGRIDVHMVTHEQVARGRAGCRGWRPASPCAAGCRAGRSPSVGLPLLTVVLVAAAATGQPAQRHPALPRSRSSRSRWSAGCWPALAAAVAGFLLLNYFFTPPTDKFTIAERNNVLALVVFARGGRVVSAVVDLAARRTSEAARARAEAETLSTLAGERAARRDRAARAARPGPGDVRVRDVTLLQRGPTTAAPRRRPAGLAGRRQRRRHRAGARGRRTPTWTCRSTTTSRSCCAAGRSRPPTAGCSRRSRAQAAVALRQERLGEQAAAAKPLAEADRTADRAAGRGQPRPAHAAGLGQGGGEQPAQPTTSQWTDAGPGRAARHRRRVAGPARPGWWRTCST